MKTRHYIPAVVCAALALALPFAVLADSCVNGQVLDTNGNATGATCSAGPAGGGGLASDGIFSCNQTGASIISIGAFQAVSGTFVPVSDNRVTLNTGYLAYKECVLRPVVDAEKRAATAAYAQAELTQFNTGRGGNPYFVQNYGQESLGAFMQGFNSSFFPTTNALNTAFRNQIQTAIARNNAMVTNSPQNSLACPYNGNLTNAYSGSAAAFSYSVLFAEANPTCDPIYSYYMAQDQINANAAAAQNAWQTQLQWNKGYYSITDANGNVITPGSLVGAVAEQALTSGFRQLENANDIGQMVGALFAGVGNQILNPNGGGLAGIGTSFAGQPSYMSQVAQESSSGLTQAVTNVALTILAPALAIEKAYNDAQNAIAANLMQTITQLRSVENTCWGLIASSTCSSAITYTSSGPTCMSTDGSTTLHIATSTAFSQPVIINAKFPEITSTVTQNIDTSNQSLQAIKTLAAGVQNTNSADIQKTAINQLDQLVAQGLLHTQADLDNAKQQATDAQTATQNLVTKTIALWSGDNASTGDKGVVAWDGASSAGWCNINKPQTISNWQKAWTK